MTRALCVSSRLLLSMSFARSVLLHSRVPMVGQQLFARRAPLVASTTSSSSGPNQRLKPRPLLRRCLAEAPKEPGVYLMESPDGEKLYIGKSVELKSRVHSYFKVPKSEWDSIIGPGPNLSRRIEVMTTLVHSIRYVATPTAAEALILEASLVKQHQPPYNVLLKDDKRHYPYVCITWSEEYPRIVITRDQNPPKVPKAPPRGTRARSRAAGGRGRGTGAVIDGLLAATEAAASAGRGRDRFYGPFVDPARLHATLALVKRAFPLRQRAQAVHAGKPCLNYDLGLCPGVCQRLVSPEEYRETVKLAEMVFRGRGEELLARLRERMERAAQAEKFEVAGEIKSQMELVRGGLCGSSLHFSLSRPGLRRDVVAVAVPPPPRGGGDSGPAGRPRSDPGGTLLVHFQVFRVRHGRVASRLGFAYEVPEGLGKAELLQCCLERYYQDVAAAASPSSVGADVVTAPGDDALDDIPDEVVTASPLPEGAADLLADFLTAARVGPSGAGGGDGLAGQVAGAAAEPKVEAGKGTGGQRRGRGARRHGRPRKVKVVTAGSRGEKHHLAALVSKNADLEAAVLAKREDDVTDGLMRLAEMFGLPAPPHRIEGYDISHTQGSEAVASGVVFVDGKPWPSGYRRYKIRSEEVSPGHSDDYASMCEVLARRFRSGSGNGGGGERRGESGEGAAMRSAEGAALPIPDLVVIDGGKGQLTAALEGLALARRLQTPQQGLGDHDSHDPDQLLLHGGEEAGRDEPGRKHTGVVGPLVVALAKREEKVYVPGRKAPLVDAVTGGASSPAMVLLRQVRDEAHRFALSYHRSRRSRSMLGEAQLVASGHPRPALARKKVEAAREAEEEAAAEEGASAAVAAAHEEEDQEGETPLWRQQARVPPHTEGGDAQEGPGSAADDGRFLTVQ